MRRQKINVSFNKGKFERKADEIANSTGFSRSDVGRAALELGLRELELRMNNFGIDALKNVINDNQSY